MRSIWKEIKLSSVLLLLVGSALLAFGLYNVHSISNVTEGGILGLTLLLEHWFGISPSFSGFEPLFPQIGEMPLLASVVGALFVGISVGICVRVGGAPTGDDALAMSLSSVLPVDIQWIYLASDLVVLLISLSYIPLNRILYSLLTVILSGQIIGMIQRIKLPASLGMADIC